MDLIKAVSLEYDDIQESPVLQRTPEDMFPHSSVYRYLPEDAVNSRSLRTHFPQVSAWNPYFQRPSYAPLETGFQMPQDPAEKSKLQGFQSPGVNMLSNFQWNSCPERSLCPQIFPGPLVEPSLLMRPGPPTLRSQPEYPSHQAPSYSSVSSGCKGSLGPMKFPDQCGAQQVRLTASRKQRISRKQRKERTVYSKEQKILLMQQFEQCQNPKPLEQENLAKTIGVTQREIKNWFKNQRAINKRKNKNGPQSSGNTNDISEATNSSGHSPVTSASPNELPVSPSTSTAGCIPKFNLKETLHDDLVRENVRYSSQKDQLDVQAPVAPPNPVEAQADPAVAEGLASVEAPVPTVASAQGPDVAQYLNPTSEQLLKWIDEDLKTWQGSVTSHNTPHTVGVHAQTPL